MKKFVFLLSILLLLFMSLPVSASETDSSISAKVNYELPYPGILPSSPFYLLHVLRDKSVGFLISDIGKKAEFDLLQADKRLAAGEALAEKGNYKLAIDTISKGENYFEQALVGARDAKKTGGAISEIASNLYRSSKKHQEILKDLSGNVSGNLKRDFIVEQKRVQSFEKIAKELLSLK